MSHPDDPEVIATDAYLDHLAAGGDPLPGDLEAAQLAEWRDDARDGT